MLKSPGNPANTRFQIPLDLTFPQGDYLPTRTEQFILLPIVPLHILLQLFLPPIAVRLGLWGFAMWTGMPIASVHEYRNFSAYERDIRLTGNRFRMQSISTDPCCPKRFPDSGLGLRILPLDPAHIV